MEFFHFITFKYCFIDNSPTRVIRNSFFKNNTAYSGGAIYSFSTIGLDIDNCTFISNKALNDTTDIPRSGQAGAVCFYSADLIGGESKFLELIYIKFHLLLSKISLIVINSRFNFSTASLMENNYAEQAGGAVYWNYNAPTGLDNLRFINNTATLYGNDKACFAQNMEMSVSSRR